MLLRVISPAGVLHVLPSDSTSTSKLCKAHDLRHAYFRNMADLDDHDARGETKGWIRLGDAIWLQHAGHGVILAATGPEWLVKHCAAMCEGALLAPDALSIEYKSVQKPSTQSSPRCTLRLKKQSWQRLRMRSKRSRRAGQWSRVAQWMCPLCLVFWSELLAHWADDDHDQCAMCGGRLDGFANDPGSHMWMSGGLI